MLLIILIILYVNKKQINFRCLLKFDTRKILWKFVVVFDTVFFVSFSFI